MKAAIYVFGVLVLFLSAGMKGDNTASPEKSVIQSRLAGSWYSADKNILRTEIKKYLDNVKQIKELKDVIALILPHAGYRYSGQTAAYGVKQIEGKSFSRIIVIGPSHRARMSNCISVPSATHYSTPLGEIPLDTGFIAELEKNPFARSIPQVDVFEHSVQIELPLLQYAVKNFKLVPIVVGELDNETSQKIAQVLLSLMDGETLVIASSDFTHFGENYGYLPFRSDIKENLEKLDMGAFEQIRKLDSATFKMYIDRTGDTICGKNSISLLLDMLPPKTGVELLKYDTSGAITSDFSNSVSYLSIAFCGRWNLARKALETPKGDAILGTEDKKELLKLARESLVYYMKNGKKASPEALGIKLSPGMKKQMGAFVTLHKNGMLRGCIGEIVPRRALYEAVMDHSVNAALNDYRFPPVKLLEIPRLEFEISALTPPKEVASYKDIVIGKNGMTLTKNGRSAVFLPQVATEQGWGLDETLSHLAAKAGLPPDAWKDGAKFTVFEAVVFSGHDFSSGDRK